MQPQTPKGALKSLILLMVVRNQEAPLGVWGISKLKLKYIRF